MNTNENIHLPNTSSRNVKFPRFHIYIVTLNLYSSFVKSSVSFVLKIHSFHLVLDWTTGLTETNKEARIAGVG